MKSLHTHNTWAGKLLFADPLLGINVIGNIYFIDFFLGGEFSTYGLQVFNFSSTLCLKIDFNKYFSQERMSYTYS